MIFRNNISLGIDISETHVSLALLKQKAKGRIHLLKAAQAPIPEDAMTYGNISDPAALAAVIKTLLTQNKIHTRTAVVSLAVKPILSQIIDLPEEMPGNLSQFIQAEIKNSAVLAGKEPQYDFCGLANSGKGPMERVFVGATDTEKIAMLLKTLSIAEIEPLAIQLPVLAAIRALYAKVIAGKYDGNILITFIHGSVITICVFKDTTLDFVRSIDVGENADDFDNYISRCRDEIDAVIQFYDIEIDNTEDLNWEIITALDNPSIDAGDLEFSLQKELGREVKVCSQATIYTDTPLIENESIENASLSAIGLAMKPVDSAAMTIEINLLPPKAEDAKATKKFLLVTANIAALILFFMILFSAIVKAQIDKTQQAIASKKEAAPDDNIEGLLAQQRSINEHIAHLTEKKTSIFELSENGNIVDWAKILEDIRSQTPKTLYITQLASADALNLRLRGNSLSFKAIHIFAELLSRTETIESATVIETNKSHRVEGVIEYSIICILKNNNDIGLKTNADG